MKNIKNITFISLLLLSFTRGFAQQTDTLHSTHPTVAPVQKTDTKFPSVQIKGLFQGRYNVALDKKVDVNGLHHSTGDFVSNTFMTKYMRVQLKAQVSERTEVATLVNLADFKSDPKTKVLENAYIKYTLNPGFAVTLGQFRPWFGIEETYPIDIIRSLDWSNQYTEFGKLGWTSFQLGASVSGTTTLGKLPMQYAVSVVNGNGKNQSNDNDNGKLASTRLVFNLSDKNLVNIGFNGGFGNSFHHKVYGYGIDAAGQINFSSRSSLYLQAEAKQATNHVLFNSLSIADQALHPIKDYQLRGFYILPDFSFKLGKNNLNMNSLEFSCRYEYLDKNYKLDSNPLQTITPMAGLEFLKNYGARLQIGVQINRYKHQFENTAIYNSNLLVTQVQVRF